MSENYYYGQQPYGGYTAYAPPTIKAQNTQPLTEEQINQLRAHGGDFNMKVTQEDLWRSVCTHKEKNGQTALTFSTDKETGDTVCTCGICGKSFHLLDLDEKEVQKIVNNLSDVLESIKTVYLDMPLDVAKQFFQLGALIPKIPALWVKAVNNFAKYDSDPQSVIQMNSPLYPNFQAYTTLLANPAAAFAAPYQQPNYGYPQAPVAPVPGVMPNYGYPQAPVAPMDPSVNPMAYGTPSPAAQMVPPVQVAPTPGVMPAAPVVAPAPAAVPAAPQQAEVQQTQVFNV